MEEILQRLYTTGKYPVIYKVVYIYIDARWCKIISSINRYQQTSNKWTSDQLMIPSLKVTCETLGLGWMSFVLGFGLLAGSMLILGSVFTLLKEPGTSQDCPVKEWEGCFIFLDTGHETHLLLFHCHDHVSHVTDAKLSRETLRHVQFQTQWCYTWSTTKSHSKKSVVLFFFVLTNICPWGGVAQKHGQNHQNLTARCTSQSTLTRMLSPWRWPQLSHVEPNAPCCCPENQDALTDIHIYIYTHIYTHIYTSQFFLWWVFSWFDLEIFSGKFMIWHLI